MKVIGLTGGIATGKSTVAKMFAEEGAAVFDADKAVHDLMQQDDAMIDAIAKTFPTAVENRSINRQVLGQIVYQDKTKLEKLEAIIHPLVRDKERAFLQEAKTNGKAIALLDIPLLFETDAHTLCDVTAVTDCEESVQRERALARPTMSEEKLDKIIAQQMSRAERNKRADYIIRTDQTLDETKQAVIKIVKELSA